MDFTPAGWDGSGKAGPSILKEATFRYRRLVNPGPGGKWQVSKDGGMFPIWSADGWSLYFQSPDSHIMVADYEAKGPVFSPGKAPQWSPVPIPRPLRKRRAPRG